MASNPPGHQDSPRRTLWPSVLGWLCIAWAVFNVLGNFLSFSMLQEADPWIGQNRPTWLWMRVLGPLATLALALQALFVGTLFLARRAAAGRAAVWLSAAVLIYVPLCLLLPVFTGDSRSVFLSWPPIVRLGYVMAGLTGAAAFAAALPAVLWAAAIGHSANTTKTHTT